jgi:ankyrin repeat protein
MKRFRAPAPAAPVFNAASAPAVPTAKEVETFHYIAAKGSKVALQAMLDKYGADIVDARDDHGRTAMIHAAITGHKELMDQLLEYGADINAADNRGQTALMAAAHRGYDLCVAHLIDRGAKMDQQDEHGLTALVLAGAVVSRSGGKNLSLSRKKLDTVSILLGKGADLDIKDSNGRTALDFAIGYKQPQVAEMIREEARLREDRRIADEKALLWFTEGLPEEVRMKRLPLNYKPPSP